MTRIPTAVLGALVVSWLASAETPQTSASSAAAKKRSSAKAKTPAKKTTTVKRSTHTASKKTVAGKRHRSTSRRRTVTRRRPYVSPAVRAKAVALVNEDAAQGADLPIFDPAALVPFFEQLYRHQQGQMDGPLRMLQYGDSHTAADEWTGDLRSRFQERFGDGGSGYSFAGKPWSIYRHADIRTGASDGWKVQGLIGHPGDGLYGLGGVSMSVARPNESVYLVAECRQLELFYLQQPGGGAVQLYDNGAPVERISTDGEMGPGYYKYLTTPGSHRFELETVDHGPVRLFGWVAENSSGVTYETLGINGAQASTVLNWDEELLKSNIERRNPALIVLAYGTNDAGDPEWTLESYREMFSTLLQRFRQAAPTASILVLGPPDREYRSHRRWVVMDRIGTIIQAQREAAAENQCAFLDLREMMGGKGSMRRWVTAGMAQYDHVHFTGGGYRLLGDAIFQDLMAEYKTFLKAREQWMASPTAKTEESAAAGVDN